jgi:hypothetical protein
MSVPGPNGGYPINIAYHSGVGMDQEASWVGLGWNINVGAINRQMRGLPDDFSGDVVTNKYRMRENVTVAAQFELNGKHSEYFGLPKAGNPQALGCQLYYNSYKGLGYRLSYSGLTHKGSLGSVGAGVHFDSQGGIGIEPNFTIGNTNRAILNTFSLSGQMGINSHEGLTGFAFSLSASTRNNAWRRAGGKGNVVGIGGSSNLSFGVGQSVPSATVPVSNVTVPFDIMMGSAGLHYTGTPNVWGAYTAQMPGLWSGFVNVSRASEDPVESYAYGYLYDQNSISDGLRDFRREDAAFTKKVPNLPTSNVTYDVYCVSGQGIGGCFRPYQQNARIFIDQTRENKTTSTRLNAELSADETPSPSLQYHLGVGFSLGLGATTSGEWDNINSADINFESDFDQYNGAQEPAKEYAPFKMYGEKTAVLLNSEDQLDEWDNANAVRVELAKENEEDAWLNAHFEATTNFTDGTSNYTPVDFTASNLSLSKVQRERRATDIEYYTNDQAENYGLTDNIGYDEELNMEFEVLQWTNISKDYSSHASGHHLSEISVLKPDGMRYVYGLPAYNTVQKDAYFSVHVNGSTFNTTDVPVPNNGTDIDPSNTPDNFLSQTELPSYVHSWLLTAVVSADYLDVTGDGPSDDDYGYWVRFNYTKTSDDYRWRVPFADASFIVGNASDINDDKATVSYGEKEVYYVQAIETKTHIALFKTSAREDGVSASNWLTGGRTVSPGIAQEMFKLDEVSLYSKAEFFSDISERLRNPSAVPIQTAHFRYSYDLCPGVPNNTGDDVDVFGHSVSSGDPDNINSAGGKLTLDTLFFTYETSSRGKHNPYVFNYDNSNHSYDRKNMDRWGNYKDNDAYSGYYPYVDFPYTEQDSPPEAGVWSLSSIDLPTGARMEISYEPDEYKYVENKRAQRMFDIVGTGENDPGDGFTTSRNVNASEAKLETFSEMTDGKFKVYFKLEEGYSTGTGADKADFFENYLDNGQLDTVYFKVTADIKGNLGNYYDYVSGYARTAIGSSSDYGLVESVPSSGNFNIGWFLVAGEDLEGFQSIGPKVHPFTRAGLEHLHYNRPDIAFTPVPQSPNALNQVVNFISSVSQFGPSVLSMIAGYNNWAYLNGCSKKIKLNGWSVIRLQDPNQKYGGGDRVSELRLTDTWENDGSANNRDNFSYGQKYSYTLEDGVTSSGVAYEPRVGGEESALRTPRPYVHSVPVKGSEHLFTETPIMESYYPAPQVGYSRVVVESIAPDNALAESVGSDNKLLHTAAPISIYEFYTQKDFPVLVDETPITADPAIVRPIVIPGIYTNYKRQLARSQGYSVVLNDMAGKLKSVEIRTRPTNSSPSINTSGNLISRQTFIYNTEEPYSEDKVNKVSSKVQVMTCSTGTVQYQTALVGQSHDIYIDMNENRENMWTRGIDANLDLTYSGGPAPLIMIMPLINVSRSDIRQRTVVTNKIIYRTGILKEVITTDNESTVKSDFIAFDKETGEPLLTKITNEYNSDIYNFTYPAHWYYPAMGGAYQNFGVEFSDNTSPGTYPIAVSSDGRIVIDSYLPGGKSATDYFMEGDQLWVVTSGGNQIYTVVKVGDNGGSDYIDCVDEDGVFIDDALTITSIRVIRSGYQNLQGMAAGSVASKQFGVTPYDEFSSTGLTSSPTSVTIDETIGILSAAAVEYADIWQTPCKDCEGTTMPNGTANPYRWGVRGKWRPLQSYAFVTQRTQNDDIAEDGVYTLFEEFKWLTPASSHASWTAATTVTKYSPNGFELENRDAIGNYSAALYEFGESVVTAIASNARHKEIAFDSFEDYLFQASCAIQYDHWGFDPSSIELSDDQHHSGFYSLKVSDATGSEALTRTVINKNCETYRNAAKRVGPLSDGNPSVEYKMDTCDCVGKFSPIIGKTYVLNAWVKETGNPAPPLNYEYAQIKVEVIDNLSAVLETQTFSASGPIIEGWQRVYGTFEVPSGAYQIRVTYINSTSSGEDCFFDDTRIHPFDANMVTYVYDPFSFRRVAELDANNFATFYVYDEEGQLSAIKKETEGGIKTLREGKTVLVPNNQ